MISRRERIDLKEWASFIASNAHVFASHPELLYQQAANYTRGAGPAHEAAERWDSGAEDRAWIRVSSSDARGAGGTVTLTGLTTPATRCCISPDERFAAAGSMGGQVVVWDRQSGQCLADNLRHSAAVTGCFFSRDSNSLLSIASDGTLKIWSTFDWTLIGSVNVAGAAQCAARLIDGNSIVVAVDDRLEFWDVNEGTRTKVLGSHPDRAAACTASPDGVLVATACDDSLVRLWSVRKGRLLGELQGHETVTRTCVFGEHGLLASGDWNGGLCIWRVHPRQEVAATFKCRSRIEALAFSADAKFLVLATDGQVVALNWSEGSTALLGRHSAPIVDVQTSADAVLTASEDGQVKLMRLRELDDPGNAKRHLGTVLAMQYSPDGSRVVTGAEDGSILVRDAKTGGIGCSLQHKKPVQGFAFSSDGRYLACVSALEPKLSSLISVWDFDSEQIAYGFETSDYGAQGGFVRSLCFSSDDGLLLFGTFRGAAYGFDCEAQAISWQINLHESADIVDIGPEWAIFLKRPYPETRVHSRDDTGAITAISCADGSLGPRRTFDDTYPVCVRVSVDAESLIVGTAQGQVLLLDANLEDRASAQVFPGAVLNLSFSRTGQQVAVCGHNDRNVYIFESASLRQLATIRPEHSPRRIRMLSTDGQLAILTGAGNIEIWNWTRSTVNAIYPAHGQPDRLCASPVLSAFSVGDRAGGVELLELVERTHAHG